MNAGSSPGSETDDVLVAAAAWRLRLAEAGVETCPEFEDWLAADEAHLDAWRKVETPWALLGEHANAPALVARRRAALARAEAASRRLQGLWPMWRRIAAAAVLVLGLAGSGMGFASWLKTQPQRYETALGERRSIELADGSRISLDSASDVRVRYTEDARRLELRRGQARFDVAHDAARPFSVRARGQSVIALGTVFNIDLLGDEMRVTLIEGRVRVIEAGVSRERLHVDQPREIVLAPGQQLTAAAEAAPSVRSENLTRVTAWERGQIDFADEDLAHVAARFNRYTSRRIVIADQTVADMRLSGVVSTGDIANFVDMVTTYLPVDAVLKENGDVELRRRPI